MSKAVQWFIVLAGSCISAYYLNWVAYVAAPKYGVFGLALKWFGLPAVIIVQLVIWYVFPILFEIAPSVWIASLMWPTFSALWKIIILWRIDRPQKGDFVAVAGQALIVLISWWAKNKWGG
jgi:hypothetical protein